MACSEPLKLFKDTFGKNNLSKSHVDFDRLAFRRSFGELPYIEVPCNWCLNCRIDKQSSLIDRCEYEYIKYGCGSFVTFTYDDVHLFKNSFIDSHSGQTMATINYKDGKDFLNRLNKLVHKESDRLKKLKLPDTLCREDYKYVIAYEYGDRFNRPHIHCLFFGLDFAYCKRLFWRAWNFQGSIEVGAIKNGGIAYATKYISEQSFGTDSFYKYTYHHLNKPKSSHSLGLGSGLYEDQIDYIKKTGNYKWHNKIKPCPTYIKNKYNVIADIEPKTYRKHFQDKLKNINCMYETNLKTYKDFKTFQHSKSITIQNNAMIKLRQKGKQVYDSDQIALDRFHTIYGKEKRLDPKFDNQPFFVINPRYKIYPVFKPDTSRLSVESIIPF